MNIPVGRSQLMTVPAASLAGWIGVIVAVLVIGLYALLFNPYWVRHGDSEVYVSVARSLARGQGYCFNGQPVAILPPGWPIVLAAAMKATAKLVFLKLLPMLCVLGFLVISYLVLCNYTRPLIAALCVVVAAMLEPVFSLSYMFFSDGLFALLAMAALWQAVRIGRGDSGAWRIAALVVLCGASVMVRWNGPLWWALIAGALVSGDVRPRLDRRWLALLLSGAATAATFLALRVALRVDPAELDPRYDTFLAGEYGLLNDEDTMTGHITRMGQLGMWIGGLLWRPLVQEMTTRPYASLLGWLLVALMAIPIWRAARQRQWLPLAVAAYLTVLCSRWTNPMPRYIVPAAPLILMIAYRGIATAVSLLPLRLDWIRAFALNVLFAGVLLVNGALYLMEVAVMRAEDFYDRSEAGTQKALIDAAWFLKGQPREGFEVAISSRRVNRDRVFFTDGHRRALNFLTDRAIVTVPEELCREPDTELLAWLCQHNVRYYLYQPPIWVYGHYQPKSRNGVPITQADTDWRLYEITPDGFNRIELQPTCDWPRSVPGL